MRTKHLTLVIVPVLLTACSSQKNLQQDVYNNQYDCAQDWRDELCEPYEESSSSSGGGGGAYAGRSHYIGPQYYDGKREVRYLGSNIAPRSNHASGSPVISSQFSQTAKSSPVRGGFGRGGFSFGG